ncbi:MAG: N-acetylmuramoyl-L-alanine amidase [Bdellovibrio sp.]|nr:N-acetylmuramoyl-L-alanine amidase [Bdellovibrio sp.]
MNHFVLTFLLFSSTAFAFHVVLDPGHGGVDLGTSRDSFVESKIVYQIAELVKNNLEKNKSITATLTRSQTQGLSLQNRVDLANKLDADLFLSLHANSSQSLQVSGMEFYFGSPQFTKAVSKTKTSSEKSNAVIEKIKQDLVQFGKMKSSLEFSKDIQQTTDQKSVIRRAPFYVIENTSMPSVLVEVGFISNRREARKLATPEYQAEIANLLTLSILKYKEKSDKNSGVNEE